MKLCPVETCWVPEATCALGHLDLRECPSLAGTRQPENALAEHGDDIVPPWSGGTLGLVDVGFVTGRGRTIVVGIVGPEDAGKTTLLAAWYLLAGRGVASGEKRLFSGSFTLSGWEAVSSRMRWAPGNAPQFPPHTSTRLERGQGLLHLAFRQSRILRDFLFTDAPGRWFQRWAVNESAADAEGARWIAEHVDAFLLVADSAALSGKDKGSARSMLQLLARRVAAVRRERPVILVWTKSDIEISQDVEGAVREAVRSQILDVEEFETSVLLQGGQDGQGVGLAGLLDRVLLLRRRKQNLPDPGVDSSDPLFLFGAR